MTLPYESRANRRPFPFSVGAAISTAIVVGTVYAAALMSAPLFWKYATAYRDLGLRLPWVARLWVDFVYWILNGMGVMIAVTLPFVAGVVVGGIEQHFAPERKNESPRRKCRLFWPLLTLSSLLLFALFLLACAQAANLTMIEGFLSRGGK